MANEFKIKNGFLSTGNSEITGSLIVTGGITGSLFGTASQALTASYVNPLNQNVIITGSLAVNNGSTNIILANNTQLLLNDNSSTNSVDWDNRILFDTGQTVSINWNDRNLFDAGEVVSADYRLRYLYGTDGSTIVLDWETGNFYGTASQALTASYVNPLNQNVIITGSLDVTGSLFVRSQETIVATNYPNTAPGEFTVDTDNGSFNSAFLYLNKISGAPSRSYGELSAMSPKGRLNFHTKQQALGIVISSDTDALQPLGVHLHDSPLGAPTMEDGTYINISGSRIAMKGNTKITGSVDVSQGNIGLRDNSYFLQGTTTGGGNVSLIGVDSSNQIYIGNQGFTNIIADDTIISGSLIVNGSSILGDSTSDTQTFIGTINISGSTKITGSLNHLGDGIQNGNYTLTGSLNHSGSTTNIGNVTVIGDNNFSGSLLISGSSTDKITTNVPLTSSANISSSQDIIAKTGSFDYIKDRGNAVIDGDLTVNGSVTFAGGLQFGSSFATASITGNTNDLNIDGLATSILVRLTSTGNYSLTGIVVPDPTKAYFFNVFNVGASNITFKSQDANSTAENRFILGGDVTTQGGEGLTLIYDPVDLRWRSPGKNI